MNLGVSWANDVVATHLNCESRETPLGIDVTQPRLSWITEDSSQHKADREPTCL